MWQRELAFFTNDCAALAAMWAPTLIAYSIQRISARSAFKALVDNLALPVRARHGLYRETRFSASAGLARHLCPSKGLEIAKPSATLSRQSVYIDFAVNEPLY